MRKLINKYRFLDFKEKTVFNTRISIVFNFILGVGKILLSLFSTIFFLISGIINFLIMLSKYECFQGIINPQKKNFFKRTRIISLLLMASGLCYIIYMIRYIFLDIPIFNYGEFIGIIIAFVSFVEMGVAITGIVKAYGKGHYYRNIKIINFCSACTAIVLTEIALTSFVSDDNLNVINGLVGSFVGVIFILLGWFILIAHKYSLIDREYHTYYIDSIENKEINIKLTSSKFYADYYYTGNVVDGKIEGKIIKGKNPIMNYNIYLLIICAILSEILIFPYSIGLLVRYFQTNKMIINLNNKMKEMGFIKINEPE